VSDAEIVEGIRLLARTEGVFAETAGGVTIGVLAKLAASGVVKPNEKVVAFITGNGLKTLDAVAPECQPTVTIAPNLEAFQSSVNVADWQ
jgi:threonine synthase